MRVRGESCTICYSHFNVQDRKPWDLGCGHCVCEACLTSNRRALKLCPECRRPLCNAHVQFTMLRVLERQQQLLNSHPIQGVVEAEEDSSSVGSFEAKRQSSRPSWEVTPWDPCEIESLLPSAPPVTNSECACGSSIERRPPAPIRCRRQQLQGRHLESYALPFEDLASTSRIPLPADTADEGPRSFPVAAKHGHLSAWVQASGIFEAAEPTIGSEPTTPSFIAAARDAISLAETSLRGATSHVNGYLNERLQEAIGWIGAGIQSCTDFSPAHTSLQYWLVTVLLGMMAYHWRLSTFMIPVAFSVWILAIAARLQSPEGHGFQQQIPLRLAVLSCGAHCLAFSVARLPIIGQGWHWFLHATALDSVHLLDALGARHLLLTQWVLVFLLLQLVMLILYTGGNREPEIRFRLFAGKLGLVALALLALPWSYSWLTCAWLQKLYIVHQLWSLASTLKKTLKRHSTPQGAATLDPPCHHLALVFLMGTIMFLPPNALVAIPMIPASFRQLFVWLFRVTTCGCVLSLTWHLLHSGMDVLMLDSRFRRFCHRRFKFIVPVVLSMVLENSLCLMIPAVRPVFEWSMMGVLNGLFILEMAEKCMTDSGLKHLLVFQRASAPTRYYNKNKVW